MQRPSDEVLVAFLDGELDETRFTEVEMWLDRDPALRARLTKLNETTALVREAFEEVLREPVPVHLLQAAHPKPSVTVLPFRQKLPSFGTKGIAARWWVGTAAAASVACIMFGASIGYIAAGGNSPFDTQKPVQQAWLDNVVGYHNMFIDSANASGAENSMFDVPAGAEKALPADILIPDLKPWSLTFEGARKIFLEGKPAYQFFYVTDNKQLGPISLTVTNTTKADSVPTLDRHANVNTLHWYHAGHGYAVMGQADKGYMWGLANDIEWQLKAI